MALYEQLGIDSVEALEAATRAEKLAGLRGFGSRTAQNLLRGIELMRQADARASWLGDGSRGGDRRRAVGGTGCRQCAYAGSLGRMKDTVGNIDILATAAGSTQLMAAFTSMPPSPT